MPTQAKQAVQAGTVFQEADCINCPKMVVIPGGSFRMGTNDRYDWEKPVHTVWIKPFALGIYEVTFDEWAACVADGYCTINPEPSSEGLPRGQRPVINISWDDIHDDNGFLAWLNSKQEGAPYRLPTEAEWEYAARAGTQTAYFFGDDPALLEKYAWSEEYSQGLIHPVGRKQPNGFGLYDIYGNVSEWTQDCWHPSYDGAPNDGSARLHGECSMRITRGGSWFLPANITGSAYRNTAGRSLRRNIIGFRVAKTLKN